MEPRNGIMGSGRVESLNSTVSSFRKIIQMSPARITKSSNLSNGYIGIDPGKSGGIVVIKSFNPEYSSNSIAWFKMPETEQELWRLMSQFHSTHDTHSWHCCLERVHSMPNEGHKGTFTFGEGFGRLKMALVAAKVSYELVEPKRWQKEFSITPRVPKEPKNLLKERCRAMGEQLFPDLHLWSLTLGMQRAVCDALLLAEYCRRKINTTRKD